MIVFASAIGVTAISVGGALVVAAITAATTNRRQRESLNHDRELADLADLRELLDEAAVALERAHDKFDDLWKRFDEFKGALPSEPMDALAEVGRSVLALRARLEVRLGIGGAIAAPFRRASDQMLDTWHDLQPEELEDASEEVLEEKLEKVETSKRAFEKAWTEFTDAAVAKAGTIELRNLS